MTLKGRTVDVLSEVAVAGPWRSSFEKALVFLGHKNPSSRTVLSFCRHFGSKMIKREGDSFSRVAVFDTGGRMPCAGDSSLAQMSLFYYFVGTINSQHVDEQGIVKLLKRFVKPGDVFFDLGANFGFYSSYVLPLCGSSGAVHAFEANPSLIPHLRRLNDVNSAYGGIRLNAMAVGKESGKHLPFYGSDRIGCSSLYPHEWLNRDSVVQVPVITVDDYVRKEGVTRIDVVKLDVEGAELDALKGMKNILSTHPPKLIVCELSLMPQQSATEEVHRDSSAADPLQVAEYLASFGYGLFRIDENGQLHAWTSAELTSDTLQIVNVAFVHRSAQG